MLQTQALADNLYMLDDGMVRQFLLTAPDKALLLDTGFAGSQVLEAVRGLTDAPVQVLLTHGDPDHAGGLEEFAEAWLHEKDWHLVHGSTRLHPLREGDTFTCGDYRLEVIEIPGHTYGSVAFADWDKGMLFAGDSVQKEGPIYLFGAHRNLGLYIQSQEKLAQMAHRFRIVYPCHHACPVTPRLHRQKPGRRPGSAGGHPHRPAHSRHALPDLPGAVDRLLLHRGGPPAPLTPPQ